MARQEGMSEVGQIVVAVLTAVAIAALTKWGIFPDEGPEGSGGGMPNIQINFGGTHHYGGNDVEPLEGGDDEEILIGRMQILNKRNSIMPIPRNLRNNTVGNRIVVVLDQRWGVERKIGVVYYNPTYGWRMGNVQYVGENGSAHFVADIARDATFLRVLTNREDEHYDEPVREDAALRYLQDIVPDDSNTFLDLTQRQLTTFVMETGQQSLVHVTFADLVASPRPVIIPAIFCPKNRIYHTPDRPLAGRT